MPSRPVFLSLPDSGSRGRKSATAAAISSRSQSGNSRSHAAASSAAVLDVDVAHARAARRARRSRRSTVTSRAERGGLVGEREAHPPRRAVADVAHGVDRLARAARRDEHAQPVPGPRAGRHERLDGGQQRRGLGEPARAPLVLARERADLGVDDRRAALRAASRRSPASPRAPTCCGSSPARRPAGRSRRARRSSAGCRRCPAASLAIVFAVAGATSRTSALRTSSRWLSGSWSGAALVRERAARGIALPLGRRAPARRSARRTTARRRSAAQSGVWMTRTACPLRVARRTTSSAR